MRCRVSRAELRPDRSLDHDGGVRTPCADRPEACPCAGLRGEGPVVDASEDQDRGQPAAQRHEHVGLRVPGIALHPEPLGAVRQIEGGHQQRSGPRRRNRRNARGEMARELRGSGGAGLHPWGTPAPFTYRSASWRSASARPRSAARRSQAMLFRRRLVLVCSSGRHQRFHPSIRGDAFDHRSIWSSRLRQTQRRGDDSGIGGVRGDRPLAGCATRSTPGDPRRRSYRLGRVDARRPPDGAGHPVRTEGERHNRDAAPPRAGDGLRPRVFQLRARGTEKSALTIESKAANFFPGLVLLESLRSTGD